MEKSLSEFQQYGCKVVVLANGTLESGVVWRKENPIPFPAYCDPDWMVYRQLGLRRILPLATSLHGMYHYAERKIKGIPFPKLYEGDDPFIMGGDFIVRKDGKMVYAFHQTNIWERPDVQDLLSCLKAQ